MWARCRAGKEQRWESTNSEVQSSKKVKHRAARISRIKAWWHYKTKKGAKVVMIFNPCKIIFRTIMVSPGYLISFLSFSKARGGPQKYGVTGWLQIQGLKKSDEGIYICHTKNKHGVTYASARLKVIDGNFFYLDVKSIRNAFKHDAKEVLLGCKWSIGEITQSCPYFHSSVYFYFTLSPNGLYSNILLQIIPASRKQKAVDWSHTAETHYSTVFIPEKSFDVSRTQNNSWCD